MKQYPLSRNTALHIYVAETKLVPSGDIFEEIGESCSEEAEYELTGIYEEEYDIKAKELLEFIRPYCCRHSLNTLFAQLGEEILEDYERIKDMKPLESEQSRVRKNEFKEQYELLYKFLQDFKRI